MYLTLSNGSIKFIYYVFFCFVLFLVLFCFVFFLIFRNYIPFLLNASHIINSDFRKLKTLPRAPPSMKLAKKTKNKTILHNFNNFTGNLLILLIYMYLSLPLEKINGFPWPEKKEKKNLMVSPFKNELCMSIARESNNSIDHLNVSFRQIFCNFNEHIIRPSN